MWSLTDVKVVEICSNLRGHFKVIFSEGDFTSPDIPGRCRVRRIWRVWWERRSRSVHPAYDTDCSYTLLDRWDTPTSADTHTISDSMLPNPEIQKFNITYFHDLSPRILTSILHFIKKMCIKHGSGFWVLLEI